MNKNAIHSIASPDRGPALPAILLKDRQVPKGNDLSGIACTDLGAINDRLREALTRQRARTRDLRNVLFSLDVPALFLDRALNIRVFTPAASMLFGLLPGDVGKPAADMTPFAADTDLTDDAQAVLLDGAPVEREFATACGAWFMRRVMPYRVESGRIEGVVASYLDISEHKRATHELAQAGGALRRFAQNLTPMRDLLARIDDPARAREILARLDRKLDKLADKLDAIGVDAPEMDAPQTARPTASTNEVALPPDMPDTEYAARRIATLSKRQRDVLALVLAGQPSKNIAADLGISQRTVEGHRAAIMKKLGVRCLPALTRLAMAAAWRTNAAAAPPPA